MCLKSLLVYLNDVTDVDYECTWERFHQYPFPIFLDLQTLYIIYLKKQSQSSGIRMWSEAHYFVSLHTRWVEVYSHPLSSILKVTSKCLWIQSQVPRNEFQ